MTNWQEIATELYEALHSFMVTVPGVLGADNQNRGNWKRADQASQHYEYALQVTEIPVPPPLSDEIKAILLGLPVEERLKVLALLEER